MKDAPDQLAGKAIQDMAHTLQPTPLVAMLNVHSPRPGNLGRAEDLATSPSVPLRS